MWPRAAEIGLAAALVASPTLWGGAGPRAALLSWISGFLVLALGSFVPSLRRLHLGTLGVATVVLLGGWLQTPRPASAWAEAQIVLGLLLALVAVIPSPAWDPPPGWQTRSTEAAAGPDGAAGAKTD